MLTNLLVVKTSQHIRASNLHTVHLRLPQCHVSIISQ